MEYGRCQFNALLTGKIKKWHQVFGVLIGYGNGNTEIFDSEFFQPLQGCQCTLMGLTDPSYPVMGVPNAIKTDTDSYIRVILHHFQYLLCQKSIGTDNDPSCLLPDDLQDIAQVIPEKRLATGDIEPDHGRQCLQVSRPYLTGFFALDLPRITHNAPAVASIGYCQYSIHFLPPFNHSRVSGCICSFFLHQGEIQRLHLIRYAVP